MIEDLRVGEIQFFFTHTPAIADNDSNVFELPHVMAKVLWYQDHPRKLSKFKHGILLSTTTLLDLTVIQTLFQFL